MTRQALNEAFLQTSFLDGTNATYIEELYARYRQSPSSVNEDWRRFFASLKEEKGDHGQGDGGPSWQGVVATTAVS